MGEALRVKTIVQSGGKVEVPSSSLPEGSLVEVTLKVLSLQEGKVSGLSFLGKGPSLFDSEEAVLEHIQKERDAWGERLGL